MRITVSVFCLVFSMAGCGEVIKNDQQVATSADVVGDPSDPTPVAQEASDIFGAGAPSSDGADAVSGPILIPTDVNSDDDHLEETIVTARPNALKDDGVVKPVRLKTATRDTDSTQ